jgi:hypothetical protein
MLFPHNHPEYIGDACICYWKDKGQKVKRHWRDFLCKKSTVRWPPFWEESAPAGRGRHIVKTDRLHHNLYMVITKSCRRQK